MIRIAHLSDIHFGDENVAALAAATAWVNSQSLDLVIVSGDLTRFGERGEFAAARAWIESLRGPRLVVPGNHDTPYFAWLERLVSPFGRYERAIGPAEVSTWTGPRLAVYGLNTARGVQPRANWSKGQITSRQVDDALAWFARAPVDAARLLVCHHPLTEMLGGPMTGKVWGGHHAAERLAAAGIDLVLSGHVHVPFVLPYVFNARCAAVGAGTLSTRERGCPAGFNVIEIAPDEVRVVAQGWSGKAFTPWRSWARPRT